MGTEGAGRAEGSTGTEGGRNLEGSRRAEEDIFFLRMDDFVPASRRSDGFLAVRYTRPPVYRSDSLMLKCPLGSGMTMFVEGRAAYLSPGDLLFVAPFATHTLHQMDAAGELVNVVLRPGALRECLPRLFLAPSPLRGFLEQCAEGKGPRFLLMRTSPFPEVAGGLSSLADFYRDVRDREEGGSEGRRREKSPKEKAREEGEFLLREGELEHLLLSALGKGAEFSLPLTEEDLLSQVLGYVQGHLSTVSLKETAGETGYHASYLSRYLKERTGKSFTEIVQVLRLDEACTLLMRTSLTVEEVMEQVGYTGKAHFYALFQERFGLSPAAYRRRNRA